MSRSNPLHAASVPTRRPYKFKVTGPFVLTAINPDGEDPKYLRLAFDDGHPPRKMAKGGNWPPEYAQACLAKAEALLGQPVYIKTTQTTKNWPTTEWLCDIQAVPLVEKSRQLARELDPGKHVEQDDSIEKHILIAHASGKTYYANAAPIIGYFADEDDFLDFTKSFEAGFVAAWSAKTKRTTELPSGVRRVRIGGLGVRTKRNGFRVVAAEVQLDDTSEAFKFFHILRIDDKLEREEYLTDREIQELSERLVALEARYPKSTVSWTP
jgi:hypothetical protein